MKRIKYIATLVLATVSISTLWGQVNSPYSRYGYGLLSDRAQGFNKGMGGVAYGMRGAQLLNTQNPASISAIDSLTFLYDIGASFQNGNFEENGYKDNTRNTSLDYVSAAFRLAPGLGLYATLRPFSTIGYALTTQQDIIATPGVPAYKHTTTYQGEGGFNEIGIGVGYEPIKNFSLGAEAMYFWGNYSHTIANTYSNASAQPTNRAYEAELSSYRLGVGMQYAFNVGRKHTVSVGAVGRFGHDIGGEATRIQRTLSGSTTLMADTITLSNAFALPTTWGLGVSYTYNQRIRIGLDYTQELWKNKRGITEESNNYVVSNNLYSNRSIVALGADFRGDPNGSRFKDHVIYRVGATYATPYTKVNGILGPKHYGLSAGVGIPISNRFNSKNMLNVAVQWEHVKPAMKGMVTENYLRISLGLTFNERWFMKWRVD